MAESTDQITDYGFFDRQDSITTDANDIVEFVDEGGGTRTNFRTIGRPHVAFWVEASGGSAAWTVQGSSVRSDDSEYEDIASGTVSNGNSEVVFSESVSYPFVRLKITSTGHNASVVLSAVPLDFDLSAQVQQDSEYAEDDAHQSGDTGMFVLAVRNDGASTSLTSDDGDFSPVATDSQGRIFELVDRITIPSSGSGSNEVERRGTDIKVSLEQNQAGTISTEQQTPVGVEGSDGNQIGEQDLGTVPGTPGSEVGLITYLARALNDIGQDELVARITGSGGDQIVEEALNSAVADADVGLLTYLSRALTGIDLAEMRVDAIAPVTRSHVGTQSVSGLADASSQNINPSSNGVSGDHCEIHVQNVGSQTVWVNGGAASGVGRKLKPGVSTTYADHTSTDGDLQIRNESGDSADVEVDFRE